MWGLGHRPNCRSDYVLHDPRWSGYVVRIYGCRGRYVAYVSPYVTTRTAAHPLQGALWLHVKHDLLAKHEVARWGNVPRRTRHTAPHRRCPGRRPREPSKPPSTAIAARPSLLPCGSPSPTPPAGSRIRLPPQRSPSKQQRFISRRTPRGPSGGRISVERLVQVLRKERCRDGPHGPDVPDPPCRGVTTACQGGAPAGAEKRSDGVPAERLVGAPLPAVREDQETAEARQHRAVGPLETPGVGLEPTTL